MPTAITITVDGADRLADKLRGGGREVRIEQKKAGHRALAVLKTEIQARIHSPSGRARKGMKQTVTGSGATLKAKIGPGGRGALSYVFSQRTRGPGRTQPPSKRLRRWARAHGIVSVHALARSIGRRGTRGRPVVRPAYEAKRSEVQSVFLSGLRGIVRRMAD